MFYFYKILQNDYIYSIDMIRLNLELNDEFIDDFNKLLNVFSYDSGCQLNRYISKSFGYHYLYNFIIEEDAKKCSFTLGLGLNFNSENKNKGFIEFNPNKCFQIKKFETYYKKLISYCYFIELVRYDLAIDIPVKRNTIKMIRTSKCVYEFQNVTIKDGIIINNSFTEYQGRRNKNKFTKLYDKTAESKLNFDLTRIEFTFDKKESEYKNLPKFLYITKNYKFNFKDSLLIDLLISCDNINYYLRKLNYKQRKRIEPYLKEHYINFDYVIFQKLREIALSFEKKLNPHKKDTSLQ